MATTDEIKQYLQSGQAEKNYELTDSEGNFIGFTPESSNKDWSAESKIGKAPIYKNGDTWSSIPEVSVSINEKTGNIDVKAPKSWFNNESFKATYNSNFLKQLAQTYKANPDTKIPDPDDSSKTWSIPELVSEYDKGLKAYAEEQKNRSDLRHEIRTTTGNNALADGLTEQDFIYMSSTGTRETDTDSSMVSLPTFTGANLLNQIRNLAGFNEELSQISRGQIKEVYDVSKASREDIIQLITSLGAHLQELANKKNLTAEDITEYARTQALITYLSKNEPEQGFWEQFGLYSEAIGKGSFSGPATAGGNLLITLEGIGNIANWIFTPRAVENVVDGQGTGTYHTELYPSVRDTPGYSTMVREDVEAQRQTEQQQLEEIAYLNRNASTAGFIAKIGTEIGTEFFIGKVVEQSIQSAVQTIMNNAYLSNIKSVTSGIEAIADTPRFVQGISGSYVADYSEVTSAAQMILDLAKTDPTALLSGSKLLLSALHYTGKGEQIAQIINSSVQTINAAAKTASITAKWGGFLADLAVNVALYDADIFRDVVENSNTEQLGELYWTIASDVLLFAGGAAIMALANYFPKTKTAARWNTYATKGITKAEVAIENTKESLKEVVLGSANYISSIKNISKRQVAEANSLIRQAKQAIATAEGIEATEEAIDNLVALQNVVNEGKSIRNGIEQGLIDYDVAPTFAPRYYEAVDATQSIINAVKESGITVPKVNLKEKGVSPLDALIPQSVSDYIGALYQYQQLGGLKTLTPAQQTRYDDVKAYTKQFEQDYPTLAAKLADTLPTWIAAYKGLDGYNIANKLVDEETLAEMGRSPLFTQGYMKVQSIEEFNNAQDGIMQLTLLATKNPTTLSMDSYQWGHMTHFKNPMAVLESAMLQSARVQEARTKLGAMTNKGIAPKKTRVSAPDYKRAQTVNALKSKFQKEVKTAFQGLKEGISNNALVRQTIDNVLQHSDYLKQKSKTQTSGAKVTRAKTAPIKITAVDKRAYVDSLPDDQIFTLALQHNGATFTDILPEEFNEAIKGKPKIRDEIKDAIASSAAFIGWDNVLGSSTTNPVQVNIVPDASYVDDYTTINNFSDEGITIERAFEEQLNNRYSNNLDGVDLTLDEKMLLADWDLGSSRISTTIDELRFNGGSLDDIANSEIVETLKGTVRGGAAKSMAPSIKNLTNKISQNQVKRPTLYRLEPVRGQDYRVGQQLDLPMSSFSQTKDITSDKGRFTTTGMFNKNDEHYILKIQPDTIGSMDISKVSSFPNQKEVLVSDSFEVIDVKEIPTPKDMGKKKTYEVTLQKTMGSQVKLTYENFVKASQFDPTLATRLDRMALASNKEYLGLKTVTEEIEKTKRARQITEAENLWQQDLDELAKLSGIDHTGQRQLIANFNNLITEYIYTGVQSHENARKTLDALVANEADPDLAKEYIILSELYDYRKELDGALRGQVSAMARQQIEIYNASVPKDKRLDENELLNTFMDLFDDTLFQRRNDALHQLQDLGSEMIDQQKIYKEINDLNDIIKEAGKTPLPGENALVESINANGQTEIYEVSPTVADLVKYDPTNVPKTWFQGFMSNKAFELSHRTFRFFTTTFNAGSFMNQAWRDSLDSYLATGTLMPMSFTEQQIVDNFGSRVAEEYRIKHPELYSQLEARAKETGRTIEEQVVRYASAKGEALAKGATEMAASRLDTSKNAWDKTKNVAERALEKAEYIAGGFREEYFRKSNYEAALYSALAENKSLDTAIEWAIRIARDATTDFFRMTYHLQAFTSTIPYLRAGVNGTKSFFRLLSLDPVGVGCRLIGGFIIPVMAATLSCLKDEENKKYYKTLKEYEKEDQLIFAVNGEFFSIPLPQGVGAFVSPMRHLVEALSDGNQHDFWELALNDFFNVLPYNMGAFMDIDGNVLASDPTLLDRIGLEAMSMLSTFSPTIVKTIFELTYGIDPYTGKPINKSSWVIDENGDRRLMDSTQSEFAQWLGQLTGGSASVIATLISDMFGNTSLDLLDSFTALIQFAVSDGQEGSLTTLPERIIGGMAGKLTVNEYDRTKSQWNQQINNLYKQKESLRQGYIDYTEKINSATSAEEREKYIANRADHIAGFMADVKTLVDNLVAQGGAGVDSYRLAALVNLVNWYETPTGQTNAYSRYLSDEQKQLAKQEARRTIERLGITTTPGQSMLGYTYRDSAGETQVKFYTPLEILNAQSIYYTSVDIFKTELTELMESAGLSNKWDGYYKLGTKAERKQYMADWNKQAVKTIAPYIEKYGAETIFRNQDIAEALDDYFFTDSYYNAKNYLLEIFGE